jgi:general secretion pathway protein A
MTQQHQEALSGLIYSVCTRHGLAVLMGEAGTGKTTLLYSLLGMLEKRGFVSALCTNPTLTREEFYDTLMIKFGVECGSSLKSRQLAALEEKIRRHRSEGRPSVLIVDEAQRLSPELLEEIRLLLNMETPTEKLLQIIVAGQPELGDILGRPELRQLKQRVSCVSKLQPLAMEELKEYIQHRLTRVGMPNQTLFPVETFELIYGYTQGIPRLVNSLCDGALQTGFALQSPRITIAILKEAARDLDLERRVTQEELPASTHMAQVAAATVSHPISTATVSHPVTTAIEGHPGTEVKALPVNGTSPNGKSGHSEPPEIRIPVENFGPRRKNVGFFGSLMGRLKTGRREKISA